MRQIDVDLEMRLQLAASPCLWLQNDKAGKLRHVVRQNPLGAGREVVYEAKTYAALVAFVEGAIFWALRVNAGRGSIS